MNILIYIRNWRQFFGRSSIWVNSWGIDRNSIRRIDERCKGERKMWYSYWIHDLIKIATLFPCPLPINSVILFHSGSGLSKWLSYATEMLKNLVEVEAHKKASPQTRVCLALFQCSRSNQIHGKLIAFFLRNLSRVKSQDPKLHLKGQTGKFLLRPWDSNFIKAGNKLRKFPKRHIL